VSLDGSGQAEQQAAAHLLPHQGCHSRIVRVPCSGTDPSRRVRAQRRVDTPLAPGSCRRMPGQMAGTDFETIARGIAQFITESLACPHWWRRPAACRSLHRGTTTGLQASRKRNSERLFENTFASAVGAAARALSNRRAVRI
jgi:hypothetical protein